MGLPVLGGLGGLAGLGGGIGGAMPGLIGLAGAFGNPLAPNWGMQMALAAKQLQMN